MRHPLFIMLLLATQCFLWGQSKYQKPKQAFEWQKTPKSTYFKDDWESLSKHQIPQWIKDAKFGVFAHFGPNAVAVQVDSEVTDTDWYGRNMYLRRTNVFDFHKSQWGDHKEFGYKDFIPMFKAEKFDADQWCDLFVKAGFKFVVPVAEHHDHFAMWDSDLTEYCAAKMGPKKDIVGLLEKASRKRGLYFGISNHRARGLTWFPYEDSFDTVDEEGAAFYTQIGKYWSEEEALEDWRLRLDETVYKYNPDMVWFDYGWAEHKFENVKRRFIKDYYNHGLDRQQEVIVTYKGQHLPWGVGLYDIERGNMREAADFFWQTDTSVSRDTWAWRKGIEIHTSKFELDLLVDIVSKNGALLLNITPKMDGTIPEAQEKMLLEMGAWLDVHGEAIYKTVPWQKAEEGDIRFTRKGENLYAHFLKIPEGNVEILNLAKKSMGGLSIDSIIELESKKTVSFTHDNNALHIDFPKEHNKVIPVLKMKLSGQGIINFKAKMSYRPSGFAVDGKATIVNFTKSVMKDRKAWCTMRVNRQQVGNHVPVTINPGEERFIRFEHSDQATYGASGSIADVSKDLLEIDAGFSKTRTKPHLYFSKPIGFKGTWNFKAEGGDINTKVNIPGAWKDKGAKKGTVTKTFTVPKDAKGKTFKLLMGLIHPFGKVYINDKLIGESDISVFDHPGAWQPFVWYLDSSLINFDGENVIKVEMDHWKEKKIFKFSGPEPYLSIMN